MGDEEEAKCKIYAKSITKREIKKNVNVADYTPQSITKNVIKIRQR